jgi:hypothetical protein
MLLTGCLHSQLNGSVYGALISIKPLRSSADYTVFGTSIDEQFWINALGPVAWYNYPASLRIMLVGVTPLPEGLELEPDALYLVEASGGFDNDPLLTMTLEETPREVLGKWYAIAAGRRVMAGNLKVSVLTHALYLYLQDEIPSLSDTALQQRLDDLASNLVGDLDGNGEVDYQDVLQWNTSIDLDSHPGGREPLKKLADAVARNEQDRSTLLALASSIVENRFGLNGNWRGQFIDGPSGISGAFELVIRDDQVNDVRRFGASTGITAGIAPHPAVKEMYRLNFSDGRMGLLVLAGGRKHAALLDENLLAGSLERGGESRPLMAQEDILGYWQGRTYLTIYYPPTWTAFVMSSSCSINGSIDCNLSALPGYSRMEVGSQTDGVFNTVLYDGSGEFFANGWQVLSNDRQLNVMLGCSSYDQGLADSRCAIGVWTRR